MLKYVFIITFIIISIESRSFYISHGVHYVGSQKPKFFIMNHKPAPHFNPVMSECNRLKCDSNKQCKDNYGCYYEAICGHKICKKNIDESTMKYDTDNSHSSSTFTEDELSSTSEIPTTTTTLTSSDTSTEVIELENSQSDIVSKSSTSATNFIFTVNYTTVDNDVETSMLSVSSTTSDTSTETVFDKSTTTLLSTISDTTWNTTSSDSSSSTATAFEKSTTALLSRISDTTSNTTLTDSSSSTATSFEKSTTALLSRISDTTSNTTLTDSSSSTATTVLDNITSFISTTNETDIKEITSNSKTNFTVPEKNTGTTVVFSPSDYIPSSSTATTVSDNGTTTFISSISTISSEMHNKEITVSSVYFTTIKEDTKITTILNPSGYLTTENPHDDDDNNGSGGMNLGPNIIFDGTPSGDDEIGSGDEEGSGNEKTSDENINRKIINRDISDDFTFDEDLPTGNFVKPQKLFHAEDIYSNSYNETAISTVRSDETSSDGMKIQIITKPSHLTETTTNPNNLESRTSSDLLVTTTDINHKDKKNSTTSKNNVTISSAIYFEENATKHTEDIKFTSSTSTKEDFKTKSTYINTEGYTNSEKNITTISSNSLEENTTQQTGDIKFTTVSSTFSAATEDYTYYNATPVSIYTERYTNAKRNITTLFSDYFEKNTTHQTNDSASTATTEDVTLYNSTTSVPINTEEYTNSEEDIATLTAFYNIRSTTVSSTLTEEDSILYNKTNQEINETTLFATLIYPEENTTVPVESTQKEGNKDKNKNSKNGTLKEFSENYYAETEKYYDFPNIIPDRILQINLTNVNHDYFVIVDGYEYPVDSSENVDEESNKNATTKMF